MKFRRRQRWLRRFALGFAFATALVVGKVAPAAAKFDERGVSDHSTVPYVTGQARQTPALSHQTLGEALKSRASETATVRPDDRAARFTPASPPVISYLSHGMGADGEVGARPDNRADRFTPGDGVSAPTVEVAGTPRDWDNVWTIGFGGIVLALGLGLAVGYLRRPRLAL